MADENVNQDFIEADPNVGAGGEVQTPAVLPLDESSSVPSPDQAMSEAAPDIAAEVVAATPHAHRVSVQERESGKVKVGRVLSNKMDKTIVVAVEHLKKHRIYKKTMRLTRKFKAHDEHNQANAGDIVRIEECRPISKEKSWRLAAILQQSRDIIANPTKAATAATPAPRPKAKAKAKKR